LGTNWRTEILAGLTTFMTMAYIVFVNPLILAEAGMPLGAVTAAPYLSAAISSNLMSAVARYLIALAPGMGLRNVGIVVASPATALTLGNLLEPARGLRGLLLGAALLAWRVRAAMLLGILGTTAIGAAFGLVEWRWQPFAFPQLSQTAGHLDIASTW